MWSLRLGSLHFPPALVKRQLVKGKTSRVEKTGKGQNRLSGTGKESNSFIDKQVRGKVGVFYCTLRMSGEKNTWEEGRLSPSSSVTYRYSCKMHDCIPGVREAWAWQWWEGSSLVWGERTGRTRTSRLWVRVHVGHRWACIANKFTLLLMVWCQKILKFS